MREARFCWACGSKMQDRNISVDAEWGKYTITINGMKAQECSECRETVISADELLTLREMGLSLLCHKMMIRRCLNVCLNRKAVH